MSKWRSLVYLLSVLSLTAFSGFGIYKALDHTINYPKLPIVEEGKVHVACIGDSITYGTGVILNRSKLSYPAQLQALLGDEYQVLNYGYSGRTAMEDTSRSYIAEEGYRVSKNLAAETYIIMLGTNDSKSCYWNRSKYKEDLKSLVESYLDVQSLKKVYIMQPPKAFPQSNGKVKYGINNDLIQTDIYDIVQEVGIELNCEVIDLFSFTSNQKDWFTDGVHPNKTGYHMIATKIYNELTR